MFDKLLSLVPYNPGLVHQMAFYSRRMREEAAIRRTGLIFLLLTFFVQFFAVLSPPQPTVADSSNDLVNGGISSAADAKNKCSNNVRHYRDILNFYGITCKEVGNAETTTIHSTGQNYYSMGWHSYGPTNPNSGKKTNETPVNIPDAGTLYWRKLASFDTIPSSTYTALKLHNKDGKAFYILFTCGNLVSVGLPTPYVAPKPPAPAPTPAPKPTPTTTVIKCPYNPALPATSPQCFQPCEYNHSIPATSPQCFKPCQYNPTIPATDQNCKPCDKSTGSQDSAACVAVHKTASNITAGISDANDTTANAGDVITYTLYAQNTGKANVKEFVFIENLSDVLDYADVTDLHGGALDSEKNVSWPAVAVPAGQTVTKQITVKVKDPIPQTPVSASDPAHFDLIMTNVYGNAVNIKLPGSPEKTIETTATSLPNTGPGTSLIVAAATVIVAAYFYSRARLLSKESDIAVKEMATA